MTDNMKKFAELLSTDENVKKEFEAELSVLGNDVRKRFNETAIRIAEKHGITLTTGDFEKPSEMKELSLDELSTVAGGSGCQGWFCLFGL